MPDSVDDAHATPAEFGFNTIAILNERTDHLCLNGEPPAISWITLASRRSVPGHYNVSCLEIKEAISGPDHGQRPGDRRRPKRRDRAHSISSGPVMAAPVAKPIFRPPINEAARRSVNASSLIR